MGSPLDLDPVAIGTGYLYAVVVGGFAVSHVMRRVRPRYDPAGPWHRTALGLIERIVSATAVVLLSAEILAGWLVLKAAGSWGGWSTYPGVFNRFLVGTSLSVAFGAGGGALAWGWTVDRPWLWLAGIVGPPLLAMLVLSFYWRKPPSAWVRFWGISVYDGPDVIDTRQDQEAR